MLIPKRVAHRKQHHPRRTGKAKGGTKVEFGDYGLQALTSAYVTNRQIEAARIAMTRHLKRGGKVWIFKGDAPVTKAEKEARQQQERLQAQAAQVAKQTKAPRKPKKETAEKAVVATEGAAE